MLTIRRAERDRIEEVALDAVPELLKHADSRLWFHCDTPTEEELRFLETELKIHHLTIEDIVKQNQRPKIEPFQEYVYLAIHRMALKPDWEIGLSELDLLLGRQWLVSVHYGPVPGIVENSHLHERVLAAISQGPDFLLYALVDLIVDSYFPIIDAIDDEIDSLQDRLLTRSEPQDMNRLLALKRALVHLRRAVIPLREVFNELTRHDFPFVRRETSVYFRDVYDHLIRIVEEIDSLRDILSGALEIHLASASNQLNVTMKRLTAWGTIFVVITAIAGIYGMNFEHMPELKWRYGYVAAIFLMIAVSLVLYSYFKRKDYL